MDAADRAMLAESVAGSVRADAEPADNDAALAALGWADMLAAEPVAATGVVFEQLGRAAARANGLDDVVATALGLPVGAAIAHPAWGDPLPGTAESSAEATIGSRGRSADAIHQVAADGVVSLGASGFEVISDHPDASLARIRIGEPAGDREPRDPDVVIAAVTAARLAIGHQLHGLAAGMLDLARGHAVERIQFGRPIASFQAVRHKLAETLVAVESAADALGAAEDAGSALAVDLARVLAGQAALDAARHGQQVLAGIGFTREHDFHRYLFAAIELDGLYGTTEGLTRELGRSLLTTREVPPRGGTLTGQRFIFSRLLRRSSEPKVADSAAIA